MQRIYSSQNNFDKEKQVGKLIQPDFKTYCKTTMDEKVWHWYKDKEIVKWNQIEPKWTNIYVANCFSSGVKTIQWEKGLSFQHMTWKNWISM